MIPSTIRPMIDPTVLRQAFGRFPTGVTAVCALVDGEPVGMAGSAFTSVSLYPALLSICLQRGSRTWAVLRAAPAIGVSVLAGHHGEVCRQLARPGDRFAGVGWEARPGGAVVISGAAAQFACTLHTELAAGDHAIALLAVHGVAFQPAGPPLVFHGSGFRQLA